MMYFRILRPWQWVKNLIILFPSLLTISSLDSFNTESVYVLILFSLLVSGNYILNDLNDAEVDKLHPKKKYRPIASGEIKVGNALIYSFSLITFSLLFIFNINREVFFWFLGYLMMANLYTKFFKNRLFINTLFISMFFLIRLYIGGISSGVRLTSSLIAYVFLLSYFLATLKKISILNTDNIKKNDYKDLLEKEDSLIDTSTYSTILLVFTNVTILFWLVDTFGSFNLRKSILGFVFLILHLKLTLTLGSKSAEGKLEDFIIGAIQDKKLRLLLFLVIVSFCSFYFEYLL